MPWRGPEYPGEFPTIGYEVGNWIQAHCVIPDRENQGQPFLLTESQLRFLLFFYRLTDEGRFFYSRGAQYMRPQKAGKGPLAAAVICAEAAGPVCFDGWDAQGEPVGRPWHTPHIQITACSEDQSYNTWRALQPMIELGPLGDELIPDTGLTRINLPGGGLLEPVTASGRSRLGQRITFAVQDETHAWLESNHGWTLADNQRRNLAGMSGRFLETTNAFDPAERSVAQKTHEAKAPGVYIDDIDGGLGSIRNKRERAKVMRAVYDDSLTEKGGWVDLVRIDAEVEALLEHDPAQAERFFLNRKLASEGAAFDIDAWRKSAKKRKVPSGSVITIGVDGARHDDAIAAVATDVKTGYQWPLCIIERPPNAGDDYEHPKSELDGAIREAFKDFNVWRLYADDQWIEHLIEAWANEFGDKRVLVWRTNRPRQIAWAVRSYEQAIAAGDVTHDGNEVFERHIANSRRRKLTVLDDKERQMHTLSKDSIGSPRKIDAAMAAVLAWEARGDCIAAGGVYMGDEPEPPKPPPPMVYTPGQAMNLENFQQREAPPMGAFS